MDELTYYVYYRGPDAEYGYGPDFVATMMWMDDYPKFYTKEEAKTYWDKVLKKEFIKYAGCEDDKTSEDNPAHGQSCGSNGPEADGTTAQEESS